MYFFNEIKGSPASLAGAGPCPGQMLLAPAGAGDPCQLSLLAAAQRGQRQAWAHVCATDPFAQLSPHLCCPGHLWVPGLLYWWTLLWGSLGNPRPEFRLHTGSFVPISLPRLTPDSPTSCSCSLSGAPGAVGSHSWRCLWRRKVRLRWVQGVQLCLRTAPSARGLPPPVGGGGAEREAGAAPCMELCVCCFSLWAWGWRQARSDSRALQLMFMVCSSGPKDLAHIPGQVYQFGDLS